MWYNDEDIKGNIINISEKIDDEIDKDDADEEKIFKLRYKQMIQGLYLNDEIMKR